MKLGFIGLGKMGLAMAGRAVDHHHELVGYDVSEPALEAAKEKGIPTAASLEDLVAGLEKPRIIWMQLPPGVITNSTINKLEELVEPGDLLIDGGNSDFRDSVKNGNRLKEKGIGFCDIGVSGGVQGAREGAGMLIGSNDEVFERLKPLLESLCAPGGYSHCGKLGAGHYAKAVHNGVEYALMQAYAEGYELLKNADIDMDVLATIEAYQNGCSIRSYILEKTVEALQPDPNLDGIKGFVADSGMGRWIVEEATRLRIPTPTISMALQERFTSQQSDSPAMQCIAAMRGTIGGHPVKKAGEGK